ncbi:Heat shock factor protein [Daldinia childiae]|nr:Heat shock factor protein [Daldinia childiae]KAF3070909.1 Heat shock factor protein [Daldinia childiae]
MPPSAPSQYPQATPSNVVARRGMNNALVATNRAFTPQQNDTWPGFEENLIASQPSGTVDEHDNIELLEEKAQRAKREAQAKRKQIPPFVQKLNSFLEESKNTDLIRWSEKGDSFIVLDEDEFAKSLIPELFKHNNYASFVRQLNMYGFHKKVGLSDNSMKASERKNKSPSEYYNPYFKRGHPNLLWLINKPKSGGPKKPIKKREEGEGESDEDVIVADEAIGHPFPQPTTQNRALPAPETGPLQKKELAVVRDQMAALQTRQKQISEAIQRLRQEHNQLYQQAIMFQNMHDRHENSINAILNFLANVFRKSLEEQGGVQNVNDLLASIIPNVQMPTAQGQGSVVDLGDWVQQQVPNTSAPVGTPKRQHRLLPPIPQNQSIKTPPVMASTTGTPASFSNYSNQQQSPQMGHVTEVIDTPIESPTPAYLKQELESNPQEGMMKIIQDANTNAGNHSVDLPNVAAHTSATLTNDQRNRMLSIMSGGHSSATPTPLSSASSPPIPTTTSPSSIGIPLTGGIPAVGGRNSLSPILSSIPPPSIQRISQTEEELEQLQRLQSEQAQKLDDLNHLLGPLSPSGRIPGLDDSSAYFDDNIDLNQYLDPNAYTADTSGNDFNFDTTTFNDGTNFDWNADGSEFAATDGLNTGRIVETNTPSHKSPSPSVTEEILRNDLDDSPSRATKRQRKA